MRQRLWRWRGRTTNNTNNFLSLTRRAWLHSASAKSLLLELGPVPIISEKGAHDILTDVATKHSEAAASSQSPERHRAVA